MGIKELIDKIREGDLTPVEVYEDFYKGWSDDRRWELECGLMAVIVTERREGRWGSSADKNCSNCYGYLQSRRQEDTTAEEKQSSSEPDAGENEQQEESVSPDDLVLRTLFGKHLDQFLKEARTCKNGTDVARLVNSYIREYKLDEEHWYRTKPLHDALFNKGIIRIKSSAWNNAIQS